MYIIVGANGYLGSYFIKNILEHTQQDILAVDLNPGVSNNPHVRWEKCDITSETAVLELNERYFRPNRDNHVVYLAAYHHPDLVEKNPRIAWNVNVTALARFLNAVENVTRFVYPSTDSVYGNSVNGHRFQEGDFLNPVNRYGLHKCVAERLVTAYGYHVVRFPFLIAPSLLSDRKHFYDQIADTIQSGNTFDMFSDSYRSSLSFNDAARLTLQLMELPGDQVPQIVNVCGDEALSKYDVGLMIARKLGVPEDLIHPISVSDQTGIFEAKRAESTLMDNSLLKKTLGLAEVHLEL